MSKRLSLCLALMFLSFLILPVFSFAASSVPEERITIITYYPAPYGIYNELRSRRMAIGDEYVETPMPQWGTDIPDGSGSTADIRLQIAMGNGYLSFGDLQQTGSNCYGFVVSDAMDIDAGSQLAGFWVADTGTVPYDLQITNFIGGGIILNTKEDSATGRPYPICMQTYTDSGALPAGNVGIGTVDPKGTLQIIENSNDIDVTISTGLFDVPSPFGSDYPVGMGVKINEFKIKKDGGVSGIVAYTNTATDKITRGALAVGGFTGSEHALGLFGVVNDIKGNAGLATHMESTTIIGSSIPNTVAMLSYKDYTDNYWAGYFKGNIYLDGKARYTPKAESDVNPGDAGDLYYDIDSDRFRYHDGTSWNDFGGDKSWTPIGKKLLGVLPILTASSSFVKSFSSYVPANAKEVLFYAYTSIGGTLGSGNVTLKIYTKEGSKKYANYMFYKLYDNSAWVTNSDHFWLPVTTGKKVYVERTGNSTTKNAFGSIYIIGYR